MRDYRDAKTMAHTLRDALAAKHHKITVGESLELVARLFGVADWNTLSAIIKNSDRAPGSTGSTGGHPEVHFAPTTQEAVQRAILLAHNRNHWEVTALHLLFALTDDPDAAAVMKACNAAPATIKEVLYSSDEIGRPGDYDIGAPGASGPEIGPAFQRVMQRGIMDLQVSGGGELTGAHLLAAIFSEREMAPARILSAQGVSERAVLRIVAGRAE